MMTGLGWVLGGGLVGLLVGVVLGWLAGTSRHSGSAKDGHSVTSEGAADPDGRAETRDVSRPESPTVPALGETPEKLVDVAAPGGGAVDGAERDRLIRACMDLGDRLRDANPALWERLHTDLAAVGVQSLVVDGQPFDRERHDAIDREITTEPARHLTVASTDFPGYTDHGRVLRRPQVVVYRLEGSS